MVSMPAFVYGSIRNNHIEYDLELFLDKKYLFDGNEYLYNPVVSPAINIEVVDLLYKELLHWEKYLMKLLAKYGFKERMKEYEMADSLLNIFKFKTKTNNEKQQRLTSVYL